MSFTITYLGRTYSHNILSPFFTTCCNWYFHLSWMFGLPDTQPTSKSHRGQHRKNGGWSRPEQHVLTEHWPRQVGPVRWRLALWTSREFRRRPSQILFSLYGEGRYGHLEPGLISVAAGKPKIGADPIGLWALFGADFELWHSLERGSQDAGPGIWNDFQGFGRPTGTSAINLFVINDGNLNWG